MPPWPTPSPSEPSQTRTTRTPTTVEARDGRANSHSGRPLPPPSTDVTYDIPTLRRKPYPDPPDEVSIKHSRSFSHPFPSFFGGKKHDKKGTAKEVPNTPDAIDDDASTNGSGSYSQLPTRNAPAKAREPVTGKCITCDATVRWPQGLKVFRCTTCLTINDLEPCADQRVDTPALGNGLSTTATRKPVPLSIDRTRAIIDHCLDEYFNKQLASGSNLTTTIRPATPTSPFFDVGEEREVLVYLNDEYALSPPAAPKLKARSPSESKLSPIHPIRNGNSTLLPGSAPDPFFPRSPPVGPDADISPTLFEPEAGLDTKVDPASPAHIFQNLESYISGCFTGCSTLNSSFASIRPPYDNRSYSDGPGKISEKVTASPTHVLHDVHFEELDAKTLLLGDVAENGSWWTGHRVHRQKSQPSREREKSPDTRRGLVNAKTPHIDRYEVGEWYRLVTRPGDGWREKWLALQPSSASSDEMSERLQIWESVSSEKLQKDISEAQVHVQRALLKATENLLKRPRMPLKHADDCRFLLILLANPLLHNLSKSSPSMPYRSEADAASKSPKRATPDMSQRSPAKRHNSSAARKSSALGLHSGVVKRILGLLSNLSNEVHQTLVSWFSRFPDSHFQRLVDLVGSFVTYRLSRQPNRKPNEPVNPTAGLVPSFSDTGIRHPSELHAALEIRPSASSSKLADGKPKLSNYGEDWQIRAAARVMSLLFAANAGHASKKREHPNSPEQRMRSAGLNAKHNAHAHGQILPISSFYNTMLDYADLVADFEAWENTKSKFSFCQYPFFLSIWAKIHVLEHDARRQMEGKAREAFFDSILSRKAVSQFLVLKVRRDCLVEDSLKGVSEVVGAGADEIKKGLRIDFIGEEGVDAGGLRKEWFLLLVREIFDPHHGLFVYDDDSHYCYFNPNCFESSEQFFLVGVLLGLAIYNSTILDVAFPPFVFKKMLASAPSTNPLPTSIPRVNHAWSLEDLAEFRPVLARGLRQLLDFDGDVHETFCRDFVIESERYGEIVQVPLCPNGHNRPVTNANRREFVDLYIHNLLDTAVVRQYEPFKRGFFTVCGGNALSLFRAEEIELLIRGSDEPLDIASLRAVATYEGWPKQTRRPEDWPQVAWFWDFFDRASPPDQRKILSFITGSDRIPAMGATNLSIRLALLSGNNGSGSGNGKGGVSSDTNRFPSARTCFNTLCLYAYEHRQKLEDKLWAAVTGSEGFGLK